MSILDKIKKAKQTSESVLSVQQFFTDCNTNGYVNKEEFLFYISNLQPREALEFEQFIAYLKDGKRLDSLPVPRKDRADNEYVWCNFQLRKGSPGVKVLLVGEMLKFIKDYQEGLFTISFTLVELYEEAESTASAA